MEIVLGISAIIIGYLLGSIPAAYILGKTTKNIDIRTVDTGNVGTASTLRAIGIWQGFVVGIIDVGKGSAAILTAQALGVPFLWVLGAGFGAFMGHNYPLYIGFKGGQGAATLIGIFAALTFWATLAACGIIALILYLNRRIVLQRIFFALLIAGPMLPIFIWILYRSWELAAYSLFLIMFMIWRNRHRVKAPLQ
ncbi:glycerol-3-phosphate acyltransferase [Chloroflexota bacterium]